MDGKDKDFNEGGNESWSYTNYERQCIEQVETQPDFDEQLAGEKEQAVQRLWNAFQNAAMACAQLYKERHHDANHNGYLWTPFQDTANTIAQLYKESLELHKRGVDTGHQAGCRKRNKDILSWAKKKRKHIRREELISYLAGRSSPRRLTDVRTSSTSVGSNATVLSSGMESDSRDTGVQCYGPLQDLSVDQQINTAPFYASTGLGQMFHNSSRRRSYNEPLGESEGREGRKRPTSSMDIVMDSPSHKRGRYNF